MTISRLPRRLPRAVLPRLAARLLTVWLLPISLLAACANPPPMTASQTLPPDRPSKVHAAKDAPTCTVRVTSLTDARTSPEMFGIVANRAIYAPEDRAAWLRSVVDGLKTRGVTPSFPDEDAAGPAMIEARFSLRSAWMTSVRANITATAVLQVEARGAGGKTIDKPYRGSVARILWHGKPGELQKGIDDAVSRALNQIAIDMHGLCRTKPPSPEQGS